jgi:hypothetical protein
MTNLALDLWAGFRVIEREWTICREDTLDVSKIVDPKIPWYDFIPITPIIDV